MCVCFGGWLGNHRAGEVMHVSEPTQNGVTGRASCYRGVENLSLLVFTPSLPSSFSASLFTSLVHFSICIRERERGRETSSLHYKSVLLKHNHFLATCTYLNISVLSNSLSSQHHRSHYNIISIIIFNSLMSSTENNTTPLLWVLSLKYCT